MGLENTTTIDLITKPFPGDGCDLVLYIVDSGSVSDEVERYKLLIDKLSSYVAYVASEEFSWSNQEVDPSKVIVRVLCRTEPNEAMLAVEAVRPRGDDSLRISVLFEDLDGFYARHNLGKVPD